MSRYEIVFDTAWIIWDNVLDRAIGNGKGKDLELPTMGQAIEVVTELRERLGVL